MYDRLKKILPIVLIVIVAVFSVLYFFIGRQYGVEYQDALYFPATEGDTTVYSAKNLSKKEKEAAIAKLEKEMREASKRLEFEYAAVLRDRIIELRGHG